MKKYNQAKMLFNSSNQDLLNKLDTLNELYMEFVCKFIEYINTESYMYRARDAWDKISKLYPNIQIGNIQMIKSNKEAMAIMESICITDKVKELQNLYSKLEEKMSYENFDKYFEKYLQI